MKAIMAIRAGKRITALFMSLAAMIGLTTLTAGPAAAVANCGNNQPNPFTGHCYGLLLGKGGNASGTVVTGTSNYWGLSANLTNKCTRAYVNSIAVEQIWLQYRRVNQSTDYWVGAGIVEGTLWQHDYVGNPQYFWERNAPDTGYDAWLALAWGTAPKYTAMNFAIVKRSPTATTGPHYIVYQGSRQLGNGNSPATDANNMISDEGHAGGESTYHLNQASGVVTDAKWKEYIGYNINPGSWTPAIGYTYQPMQVPTSGYFSIPAYSQSGITFNVPSVGGYNGC